MTDYEYLLRQAKFFHYKGWESGELRKCVEGDQAWVKSQIRKEQYGDTNNKNYPWKKRF